MRRSGSAVMLAVATAIVVACGFTAPGELVPALDGSVESGGRDAASADASAAASDSPGPLTYQATVGADAPILYYRLEEAAGAAQVASEIAGSPPATVLAAPRLGASGKIGSAIAFNGTTNGYLEVNDDRTQFVGVAPYTLEAWVFPLASDGTYRHVFIRDTNDQNGGRNEYGVWLQDSKLGFERYSDGKGAKAISGVVTFSTWHHVVAVYDGAKLTLWLDGQAVAQQADVRQTKPKDKPLRFGSRDPDGGQWNGTIDEIAVYDHVLTGERIKAHFQAAVF